MQVDLQLESGEYFLKKHEKDARESAQRKQKVRSSHLIVKGDLSIPSHSKQKQQKNAAQNVRKRSLLQQRMQRLLWKRRGRNGSGKRWLWSRIWWPRTRARQRVQKRGRKRKSRSTRQLWRRNRDYSIICGSFSVFRITNCGTYVVQFIKGYKNLHPKKRLLSLEKVYSTDVLLFSLQTDDKRIPI